MHKTETPKDIILISAAEFEAENVRIILQNKNCNIHLFQCGIGAIDAAMETVRFAEDDRHKKLLESCAQIIFLGTAGIFGIFSEPENFAISRVSWLPIDERFGLSYRVKGTLPAYDLLNAFYLPKAFVICSQNISLTAENSPNQSSEIFLENLELYSVAKALYPYLSKFWAVLTTTNAVGPKAHESWQQNFKLASVTAAEWFEKSY